MSYPEMGLLSLREGYPPPEVPVLALANPEEEPLDCTFGEEDAPLDSMRADQILRFGAGLPTSPNRKDFGELVFRDGSSSYGVVLLRFDTLTVLEALAGQK